MRDVHIARLSHEYRDVAPVARRFADILAREIGQLVARHDIPLAVPIEHRVKSWTSIEDKLGRMRFHLARHTELLRIPAPSRGGAGAHPRSAHVGCRFAQAAIQAGRRSATPNTSHHSPCISSP